MEDVCLVLVFQEVVKYCRKCTALSVKSAGKQWSSGQHSRALCARYGVRAPIVQAPMADAVDWRAAGACAGRRVRINPCATLAA